MVGRIRPDLVTWIHPERGYVQGEKLVLQLAKWDSFMFITKAESLNSNNLNNPYKRLESLEAEVQFSIDGPGKPKQLSTLAYQRALWMGLTNVTYLEQETGIKPSGDVDYISAGLQMIIKHGYIPKKESNKLLTTWDAYKARICSIRQPGEVKD